jgi:hypothetical protein
LIRHFQRAGGGIEVELAVQLLQFLRSRFSDRVRAGRRKRMFSRTVRLGNSIGSCGTR